MGYKRINFILEKSLYAQLKKRAAKQGVPISKTVTTWIQNSNINSAKISQQKITGRLTTYNFWVDKETYKFLKQISGVKNAQISTILRSLIFNNLNQIKGRNACEIIKIKADRLWLGGQLMPLKKYLYSNLDSLDTDSRLILARVYLELGMFDEAKRIGRDVANKKNNQINSIKANTIRSKSEALLY
ncbi:MAG: hypothetical protein JW991_00785 [Candidatus Pacebacteria bacterium]|nr:hypothetical protein [Candidatus Paceibacterota bacterium]